MLKLFPPKGNRKTYYVRGTDPVTHRRIDQTTNTANYAEAKQVRDKLNKDLLNGILGRKISSFAEMAVEYIESRKPGISQTEAIIGRERTDGSISPCLVTDFADVDDCRKIVQARVNAVIKARFEVNKHGQSYKPGTIVRELIQPLTCVLNYAHKEGYCDSPHFIRPRYNDERLRYGTADECRRLLAASAPHVVPIWLFAMFIGDRIGESLELQVEDVNLDWLWAVLRDTKNGKHRGIALHAQIVELLRVIIGNRTSGHVFLTDDGRPYATVPKTAWNRACKRAGIEDFHIHDLRHTFGTNALVAGVPRRMQEQQMGHAAEGMYGRYAHVPDRELIEAINRLPRIPFEIPDYRSWAQSGYGRAASVSQGDENRLATLRSARSGKVA
jgi:integrase